MSAPQGEPPVFDAGERGCTDGLTQEFRQRMDSLESGQTLVVVVREPGAKADLPAMARLMGHEVRSVEPQSDGSLRVTVARGA